MCIRDSANTLDGRDDTAWNSDGDRGRNGAGATLTYTFDKPRRIVRITVRNGYVRSPRDSAVYAHNDRLRRVRVTTQHGSRTWDLADSPDPQTLTVDLGVTSSVQLVVETFYVGKQYQDLALTEISFAQLP